MRDLGTIARSASVGLVATLLDFALLSLLVSGFSVPVRIASVPALSAGIGAQFIGNQRFAFPDASRAGLRQLGLFLFVEALGFVSNLLLFDRLVTWTPLPYLVCRVLSSAIIYFAVCFPLWARVFAGDQPAPTVR
jgi:putative flippase GtrA